MKKLLYILAAVLLLASCEKDPFEEFLAKKSHGSAVDAIWDITPLELAFEVTDRQGNNLFDESTPGNWPDRSQDVIRVQHAFRWNKKGQPEQFTALKVNGKPVEGPIIRLAK